METLITGDQLVGKSESRHQASLLQPKDSAKGPGEEDSLHGSKSNQSFGERSTVVDPADGPLSLLLHARNSFDGVEKAISLNVIFHICIN